MGRQARMLGCARRTLAVLALVGLAPASPISPSGAIPGPAVSGRAEQSRPQPPRAPRMMTTEDVVGIRGVTEAVMSPDARRVAMVISEPSVKLNAVTSRVVVADARTTDRVVTAVAETHRTSRITNLRWSRDGRSLRFLSSRGGADEVWEVRLGGGRPHRFFDSPTPPAPVGGNGTPAFASAVEPPHPAKVLAFETSPDGQVVAYTTPHLSGRPDPAQGVAYDDRTMNAGMIQRGRFDVYEVQLWLRDLESGRTRLVATLPVAALRAGGMAWSPDGSKLAVVHLAAREAGNRLVEMALAVVDRASGRFTPVASDDVAYFRPVWSPDATLILGQHGGVIGEHRSLVGIPVAGGASVPLAQLPDDVTGPLYHAWWSSDGTTLAADIYAPGMPLYVGRRGGRLAPVVNTAEDVSACAFDAALRRAVCAGQTMTAPPRLVVVDVAGRTIRPGYDVNPQLRDVQVVDPEPKRWTNRYGTTGTGYQIVPAGCRSGGRCPVVVITHGMDARNKFMDEGLEWNYPSQVFAARGFVVLLVNEAKYAEPGRPWEEQRLRLGLDAVAIMEAAVTEAAGAGSADPNRAGIMGYSHGGQTGALAIAHTKSFRAASLANWGDGPTTYWGAGTKTLRDYWAARYGGSPVDPESADHWRELDPAQNAHRIEAAVLLQFDDGEAAPGLELYSYLRDQHKPVELRIFPGENHVFYEPRHRISAMEQNLAWFAQWLH